VAILLFTFLKTDNLQYCLTFLTTKHSRTSFENNVVQIRNRNNENQRMRGGGYAVQVLYFIVSNSLIAGSNNSKECKAGTFGVRLLVQMRSSRSCVPQWPWVHLSQIQRENCEPITLQTGHYNNRYSSLITPWSESASELYRRVASTCRRS
jgi:hypothetical protein